ncbi:hypothetical protein NUU61_007760 [Penicillium alfredii]|uniref:HMG box domain-containing protein n=1 Tax=Penicillium alfredii TaxID=1506179 RepID=A0A9W9ER31_9EURO|nr:uncharacterized protein NUU61_007760 [Penicillium alfredii]KAJ5086453.1 hypothetical protein NUU61_007760 [Penicillium alfredii]
MPWQYATRRAIRPLRLGVALARHSRVVGVQNQLRRIAVATSPRLMTPCSGYRSAIKFQQSHTYATTSTPKSNRSTKSKPAKKSKKTAKKPVKKPAKKRVLTEKQLEKKKQQEHRQRIKELKEASLTPPAKLPQSAYIVALTSKLTELRSEVPSEPRKPSDYFSAAAGLVRSMNSAELEEYRGKAESNKATNSAAYESWVKSHTPLQIKEANLARRQLARLQKKVFRPLKDDRQVKQPLSAFIAYNTERNESGDFKHVKRTQVASRVAEEWKELTPSEKQRYVDLAAEDRERYIREHLEVYGEVPKRATSPHPESA